MKRSTKKLIYWSLGAVGAVVVAGVIVKKVKEARSTSNAMQRQYSITGSGANPNVALAGMNTYAVVGNQ